MMSNSMKMRCYISLKVWYKSNCILCSYRMCMSWPGKSSVACSLFPSTSGKNLKDKIGTQPKDFLTQLSLMSSFHSSFVSGCMVLWKCRFFKVIYLSILSLGGFQAWIINKWVDGALWVQLSQPVTASSPSLSMPAEITLLRTTKCPDHHCQKK